MVHARYLNAFGNFTLKERQTLSQPQIVYVKYFYQSVGNTKNQHLEISHRMRSTPHLELLGHIWAYQAEVPVRC